jgi:monoamine oxidase
VDAADAKDEPGRWEIGEETRSGLSRRRLLGGAAAGAAGYALGAGGAPAPVEAASRPRRVDVVVVGAGLAGLRAAQRLRQKGHSVAVLEARDRVGGRILNRGLGGNRGVVEVGGQWVGPTQHRIQKLISDLGLRTFPTFNQGKNVYYRASAPIPRQTYTGAIPPANGASLIELAVILARLNQMAAEVPLDRPWTAARAAEYDGQTLESFKQANTTIPETRDLFDLGIQAVFAAEPRDLSLLHTLFYIHSAGSFENLINTQGGAQEQRIVGGSQRIAIKLAKQLGRSIVLEAPVMEIERVRGGVIAHTPRGAWKAKRAIVAVPPTIAGRIRYSPRLPGLRDQLTQRVPMGTVIKTMVVYDRPFWRDDGLTGQATSDTGAVRITYDNSPPDGKPGVMLGFIEGTQARRLLGASRRARRSAVLESLERYFGSRARTGAKAYIEKSWADEPWTRGCYVGFMPPGVLLDYGEALRRPVGPIHWAGTETATVWNGYLDGAVQSGDRAAREVMGRL